MIDFQNKKINDWLSLSLIHDHFRKLTMRQMKMKFNYRFQRENFFINANSRSFSLIHVVDDFLLIRVSLRMIRRFSFEHSRIFTSDKNFVYIRFLYEQLTIFFNFAYFYERLTILFFLFAYFDEQSVSTENLIECQLISQNSKREICCAKNNESSSLRIDKKISCWK